MADIEIKQKKEKKVMTPERLEQLARARKKAQEIKAAGAVIRMEAKIASITKVDESEEPEELPTPKKETKKASTNFKPTPPNEIENKIVKAELIDNPVTQEYVPEYSPRVDVQPPLLRKQPDTERVWDEDDEEEPEPEPPKPVKPRRAGAKSRPIKTKIVIEQSSDDEDEFHPHEHVIFVKRKSKNDSIKKVIPAATPTPPNTPEEQPLRKVAPNERVWEASHRQLPTVPLANSMDDFVNAGFSNYRKYY